MPRPRRHEILLVVATVALAATSAPAEACTISVTGVLFRRQQTCIIKRFNLLAAANLFYRLLC